MTAADCHAAAFFCQSVAHLLAPPGAEDEAVRHLRAEDLPDLLMHLRERLAQALAEGEAAGAARERAAVVAMLRADARQLDPSCGGLPGGAQVGADYIAELAERVCSGEHIAEADADSNNEAAAAGGAW
jgi:hypothetical protein